MAESCAEPVLKAYLEACARMDVDHVANTPLIAADLELTGLDREHDRIVALGWTLIDNGRIQVGSSRHQLTNTGVSVGSSATVHELLDSEVAQGECLETALLALFEAARGRAWVFHHGGLDVAFLKKACLRWAGTAPCFALVDTMQIELRLRRRRDLPVRQGDLQLGHLRNVYGLPRYTAHNALTDAFATAELMLAIAARLDGEAPAQLAPYLQYL